MTKSLAKGLSQIADSLPRTKLATVLYPTKRMKQAVAELYAHIIEFLIRAQKWYHESKALHIFHSFIRPVELRCSDLIDEIKDCTLAIDGLTSAGAHAEQRDMHLELKEVSKNQKSLEVCLSDIRQIIIGESTQARNFWGLLTYPSQPSYQFKRLAQYKPVPFGFAAFGHHGTPLGGPQVGCYEELTLLHFHEE